MQIRQFTVTCSQETNKLYSIPYKLYLKIIGHDNESLSQLRKSLQAQKVHYAN